MKTARLALPPLAIILASLCVSDRALSQTAYTWLGGDGSWSNASMWSPNGVPGTLDTARVTVTGAYRVTVDSNVDVEWLEIGDGATGQIEVDLGASSLTVRSNVIVDSGGLLCSSNACTGGSPEMTADTLVVRGNVQLSQATINAELRVESSGSVTLFRVSSVNGSADVGGSLVIAGSYFGGGNAVLTISGLISNTGIIMLTGDHSGTSVGTAKLVSPETLVNTGEIRSRGTDFGVDHVIEAVVDNQGAILVDQRNLRIEVADASHLMTGTITVGDGRSFSIRQSGTDPSVALSGPVVVNGSGTFTISSGRVDVVDPSILNTGGTVTIDQGAAVHLGTDHTLDGTVTVKDSQTNGPGSLTVGGMLTLESVTYNTDLDVLENARLDVRRTVTMGGSLSNLGSIWVISSYFAGAAARLELSENLRNDGTLVLWADHAGTSLADARITPPDTLINSGRMVARGSDIQFPHWLNGLLINRGELLLQERDLTLARSSGEHVNSDTIRIASTHTLRLSGGAGLRHAPGSLIAGDGTLHVTAAPGGVTTTSGAVGPGMEPGLPGALRVEGSLTMTPDAFFEVDLAGTAAGTEYDQLHVTGTLALDGTLRIAFPDTFDTAVGDTFNVATAGAITGTFGAVEQVTQSGKHFSIVYEANVVRLITLSGGVAIEDQDRGLPERFVLHGAYPNPFNPSATLRFDLPASAEVTLSVFDLLGRRVRSIGPTAIEAGAGRTMLFEAGGLPSGLYLYRLEANGRGLASVGQGSFTLLK